MYRALGVIVAVLGSSLGGAAATPNAVAVGEAPVEIRDMAEFSLTMTGAATTWQFSIPAGTYRDAAGDVQQFSSAVAYVCTGTSDNPHYSSGSSGVIAKSRVSCTGPNSTIPIRVLSLLGRTTTNSISSLKIVKESEYPQSVVVNGPARTWYVPELGENGAKRGAYFRASHAGQSVPPMQTFSTRGGASKFVYVK